MSMKIYHNPRCSKSRQTLALLNQAGVDVNVVRYLEQPPSSQELNELITQLGISPRQLLRRGEGIYQDLGLDDASLSDAALITAMVEHPKLIERPIVSDGKRAVLGRPPENVNALLR